MRFQYFRAAFFATIRFLLCLQLTISAPLAWGSSDEGGSYLASIEATVKDIGGAIGLTPDDESDEEIRDVDLTLGTASFLTLERGSLKQDKGEKEITEYILKKPISFFSPIGSDEQRVWVPGDSKMDLVPKVYDELAKLTNLAGLGASTPYQFHVHNEELFLELTRNIRKNPEQYGYTADDVNFIQDITDVDFEVIMEAIINDYSTHLAVYWAPTTALFENFIHKKLDDLRAWGFYVLKSLGIETAVMSFFSYQAMKQIYVAQRYHAYMNTKRLVARAEGKDFNSKEATAMFARELKENFKFDERFKLQVFKAWGVGLLLGTAVKTTASRGNIETAMRWVLRSTTNSDRVKNLKIKGQSPVYMGIRTIRRFVRAQNWQVFFGVFKTPPNSRLADVVLSTDEDIQKEYKKRETQEEIDQRIKQVSRVRGRAMRRLGIATDKTSKFAPLNVALTAADTGIKYLAFRRALYLTLFFSTRSIAGTYINPGHAIQNSLIADKGQDFNPHFLVGSREALYPLCLHLAYNSYYHFEGDYDHKVPDQVKGCRAIISAFEGVGSDDKLAEILPEELIPYLSAQKGSPHFSLSQDKIQEIIDHIWSEYPLDYRITWLAAIRAIYTLDWVPPIYYRLAEKLLRENGGEKGLQGLPSKVESEFFTLNPSTISAHMNLDRLNFATETISAELQRRTHNQMVESGKKSGALVGDISIYDKSVDTSGWWEDQPNLTRGFLNYLLHQRMNTIGYDREIRLLADKYEKAGLEHSWYKMIGSLIRGRDETTITKLPPKVYNMRYRLEKEVDGIVDKIVGSR